MILGAIAVLMVIIIKIANGPSSAFETALVKYGDILQEVSVTGRIKNAQNIDLSFEKSGRLMYLIVNVGGQVVPGQLIAQIDNTELVAQVRKEEANVDAAQAKLDQLLIGAKAEDIGVAKTSLSSAKRSLEETQKEALDIARTALNSIINTMIVIADVQNSGISNISTSSLIESKKETILYSVYGQHNLGSVASWYFLNLNGGLKEKVVQISNNFSSIEISQLLADIRSTLLTTQVSLDLTYSYLNGTIGSDTSKSNINLARTDILNQISKISGQVQSIITAENLVNNSQAALDLKEAPASNYEIENYRAIVKQAQANLDFAKAQLAKNSLRSPIFGTVANLSGNVGELISATETIATIIGRSKFQIEANIPEADIAKIKVSNSANVTVDAYGQDANWEAKIIIIYPGEKIIEGVATYKTILEFVNADNRIKSGMTANIDIQNEKRISVLIAPQRALIRKDGKKFFKILINSNAKNIQNRFANLDVVTQDDKQIVYEVPVEVGLQGADGKVEVISGLKEGDKIVVN